MGVVEQGFVQHQEQRPKQEARRRADHGDLELGRRASRLAAKRGEPSKQVQRNPTGPHSFYPGHYRMGQLVNKHRSEQQGGGHNPEDPILPDWPSRHVARQQYLRDHPGIYREYGKPAIVSLNRYS